jgi:ABC-type branched-subunit amino acid transport system substrate-binding protein
MKNTVRKRILFPLSIVVAMLVVLTAVAIVGESPSSRAPREAPARPAAAGQPQRGGASDREDPAGPWTAPPAERTALEQTAELPVLERLPYTRWETFTVRDGLPADKAFALRVDGDRVWVGTTRGLALYEEGRWRRFGTRDGLPNPVILGLDVSPRSGDLWIATMGGLARYSGGRIDAFTQLDSGLPNNFVNAVRCDPEEDVVWAATAMGAGRLDLRSGEWSIFTHLNTPMKEPWTYSIAIGDGKVYVGSWGAGVLEYTKATGRWREYLDPDHEFEIDLFADDGPVNDVTSGVDWSAGVLWQVTYTGATRYDGREWRSYFKDDTGVASDFINFTRTRGGQAWLATDDGLSLLDGEDCVTYRRDEQGRGEVLFYRGGREVARRTTPTAPAHNYVLGVDLRGSEVWLATGEGVSRGIPGELPGVTRAMLRGDGAAGPAGAVPASDRDGERFAYAGAPEPLLPYNTHRPYREFFTERSSFRGPGRTLQATRNLEEVRIGFIGPLVNLESPTADPEPAAGAAAVDGGAPYGDPKEIFGRRMMRGATLAVEEANAAGGFNGLPFSIVPRTDMVLWGQTSNEMVKFAEDDRVWAILSSIDSNHNHVLSRTSIKTEIPILNAGSTDPTLVEHSVPWLVRCMNDDRQNSYALLAEMILARGIERPAVLRVNDRDGRVGVMEFVQGARLLGHPVVIELRFANGDTDFRPQLSRIREMEPDALVVWGNPGEAAGIVRQARDLAIDLPIFGFTRMATDLFLEAAGDAAEGIVVVAAMNPERGDPAWVEFFDRYRQRWDEAPDSFAAHAYDGMTLLIEAVRIAGLNRARIRDALFDVGSYHGVTGEIRFDTNMNDIRPPWLAEVREGRFRYFTAPAWPVQIAEEGER